MSRTARLWRGIGPMTLGGLMLAGPAAFAAAPSPSQQLVDLGRQAAARGYADQARTFYRNALKIDPANAEARAELGRSATVRRVALQDPAAPAPEMAPPADAPAPALDASTPAPPMEGENALETQARLADVARQAFVTDIRQREAAARERSNAGDPEGALAILRDTLTIVTASQQIPEDSRRRLENEVRNLIGATERLEERTTLERAERYRIYASQTARSAALDRLSRDQDTVFTLMTEFDSLMSEGNFRVLAAGGLGDIETTTQPYVDARFRAQAARALAPSALAPYAGMFTSDATGFLAQAHQFELLKEYRAMLTLNDVDRSAVPFPDTRTIEYPERAAWQAVSERRILKYSNADYLFDRDEKTKAILSKLNERISMSFPNDTPLEDVKRYIEQSTQDEAAGLPTGIPIYVDPQGLQDADKTMASPVSINLEGIPLRTTLRLLLKQLDMTYTVKDGLLTITSNLSEDQPTEIRVYQVADLAIIPLSLFGMSGGGGMGGGMGGMGGGMGGMGGGMGGMGGGMMGGMGGGMGGMGGGMGGMGGMMSVAPQDPSISSGPGSAFEEKKSN